MSMTPPSSDGPQPSAAPDARTEATRAAQTLQLLAHQLGQLLRVSAGAALWKLSSLLRRLGKASRVTWQVAESRAADAVQDWRAPTERRSSSLTPTREPFPTAGAETHVPRTPWRRQFALAGAAVCVVFGGALALFLIYCAATLPFNGGLKVDPAQRALVVEAADGQTFAARGAFRGEKVALADLPAHLKQAVVAIEDRRFYDHLGLDGRGMARAMVRNARAGGAREGASTLTQQLVRLTYLSPEKSLRRKVQEAMIALWLETQLTKDEILQRYLNTAYFGAGAYGIDAAAKRYFGKPPKELSLGEAAMLAGLVRAPSQLAPTRNFGGAKERADTVLQAMVETGAITQATADGARAEPIALRTPPETPPGTNYFVDLTASDLRRLAPAAGDVTMRTTINLDLQQLAEGIIDRRLDADGSKKGVGQAALVALGRDGAVLALVGGRDYEQSQFNRATQAKRQAGSLFKLFVYLAALEKGYTPDATVVDRPVQIGDWEPQNASGRFRGRTNLRTAFAQSINTVSAQLADEVGIPAVIDVARRLGVQADLPNVPSLALGSAEVTLMEMTRAYASVAAGAGIEPFGIRTIQGGSGQPLYARSAQVEASPALASLRGPMLDLLQAVVREGTGKAARLPAVPVAGKTGTTQEYRDAWFIGSTPDLTIGVWVGNDDNAPMNRVSGGDLPAQIFHDVAARAAPLLAKRTTASTLVSLEPRRDAEATATVPSATASAKVIGSPRVLDTGTIAVDGRVVRLRGVEGEDERMARQLARFLRGREVICEAANEKGGCTLDGQDLAEMIVAAGGARARSDAPDALLAAEEQARSARLGVWRRRR